MKLYKWQEDCLREWENNDFRGIVNAVTGTGKTMLALAGAARLFETYPHLRIHIVAPTIALANQWRQAIVRHPSFKGIRPGFCGDGIRDEESPIMIYVINSARSALPRHIRADLALGNHVLLICDECHRYKSRENYRVFSFIDDSLKRLHLYHCIGLSATPFNGSSDDLLTSALGREIYCYNFNLASSEQTISPFFISQVATDFFDDEREEYRLISAEIEKAYAIMLKALPYLGNLHGNAFMREVSRLAKASDMSSDNPATKFLLLTYSRKRISVLAEARIRCCLDIIDKCLARGKILVFTERVEQAERIHRLLLRRYGSIAGIYHSGMSRTARTRVLSDFREGRSSVLVSCRCLDEGIDVPDASIGIIVSGSAVPRQRIQRLGRIIRRSDGKEPACLYYIYIRDTSEDSAYLMDITADRVFDLRYYSNEGIFSNDIYEHIASSILRNISSAVVPKSTSISDGTPEKPSPKAKQLLELRSCINEGICLPDYLLDEEALLERIKSARNAHERNYYLVMRRIHEFYSMSSTEGVSSSS